mmetsp:Transcript_70481/g.166212  ORF Transcript_70481/g.166212 Transcript_70481/m.166212 type:complete len:304 (+) Transcript_70481:1718-2629(+)
MVDGRRVVAAELELGAQLEGAGQLRGHLAHAALQQVQQLQREGAHRAFEHDRVRHHIGGLAGVDHRHRDHAGVDRPLVAADDGLEGRDQLAGRRHRVQAQVRHGRVRSLAAQRDLELIAAREHRAALQRELAGLHAGPVVRAEHGLHRELLEQAVLDHLAGAAAAFLGGLEDEVDRAVEVAMRGQVLGGRQQHRGVAVVATGVHAAEVAAGVRELVALGHRQRVDVGAQAHRTVRAAVLDDADDAGGAEAAVDGDAPVGQRLRDDVGSALLVEAEFRVLVQVAADGGDLGRVRQDGVDELHCG